MPRRQKVVHRLRLHLGKRSSDMGGKETAHRRALIDGS